MWSVCRSCSALLLAALLPALCAAQNDPDPIEVTIAFKSPTHPEFDQGFPYGYVVDGVEAGLVNMTRGLRYTISLDVSPFQSTRPQFQFSLINADGSTMLGPITHGQAITFVPTSADDPVRYADVAYEGMGGPAVLSNLAASICEDESIGLGSIVRAVSGDREGLTGEVVCSQEQGFVLVCWQNFYSGHDGNQVFCTEPPDASCPDHSGWFVRCSDLRSVFHVESNGQDARCNGAVLNTRGSWALSVSTLEECEAQCAAELFCDAFSWRADADVNNCLPTYDQYTGFTAAVGWQCFVRRYDEIGLNEHTVSDVAFVDEDEGVGEISGVVRFRRLAQETSSIAGYRVFLASGVRAVDRADVPIATVDISLLNSTQTELAARIPDDSLSHCPRKFSHVQVAAYSTVGESANATVAIELTDIGAISETRKGLFSGVTAFCVGLSALLSLASVGTEVHLMLLVTRLQSLATLAQLRSRDVPDRMRQLGDRMKWVFGDFEIMEKLDVVDRFGACEHADYDESTGQLRLSELEKTAYYVGSGRDAKGYAIESVVMLLIVGSVASLAFFALFVYARWRVLSPRMAHLVTWFIYRMLFRSLILLAYFLLVPMFVITRFPGSADLGFYILACVYLFATGGCLLILYTVGVLRLARHEKGIRLVSVKGGQVAELLWRHEEKMKDTEMEEFKSELRARDLKTRVEASSTLMNLDPHLIAKYVKHTLLYLPFFEDCHFRWLGLTALCRRALVGAFVACVQEADLQLWLCALVEVLYLVIALQMPREEREWSLNGWLDILWTLVAIFGYVSPFVSRSLSEDDVDLVASVLFWSWVGVLGSSLAYLVGRVCSCCGRTQASTVPVPVNPGVIDINGTTKLETNARDGYVHSIMRSAVMTSVPESVAEQFPHPAGQPVVGPESPRGRRKSKRLSMHYRDAPMLPYGQQQALFMTFTGSSDVKSTTRQAGMGAHTIPLQPTMRVMRIESPDA